MIAWTFRGPRHEAGVTKPVLHPRPLYPPRVKILVLSSLYPNAVQRRHGIFIEHRLAHTLRPGDEAVVVAPVPWFPFAGERWGQYGQYARVPMREERRGLTILHPRVPVIPKLGQTLAPSLMTAARVRP